MARKLLKRKAPDPEREQLKQLIREADIPPHLKALAVLGVGRMSPDQVTQAVQVVPVLTAAAKAGDREEVRQVLIDQGLPLETVTDAMDYYDQLVGANGN